jgi:hypothetical protein
MPQLSPVQPASLPLPSNLAYPCQMFNGWPIPRAAENVAGSGCAKETRLGILRMAGTQGRCRLEARWPAIDQHARNQASAHAFRRNEVDPEPWGQLSRERRLELCFKFRSENKYCEVIKHEESEADPWCSWYLLSTASSWSLILSDP